MPILHISNKVYPAFRQTSNETLVAWLAKCNSLKQCPLDLWLDKACTSFVPGQHCEIGGLKYVYKIL